MTVLRFLVLSTMFSFSVFGDLPRQNSVRDLSLRRHGVRLKPEAEPV